MDQLLHFGRQDTDPNSRFELHLRILAAFLLVVKEELIEIVSCENNTQDTYEVGQLEELLEEAVLEKQLEY